MRVLIADFDLYSELGGGQTFYRAVIEKYPEIEFHYLETVASSGSGRPANAHPIPFQIHYENPYSRHENPTGQLLTNVAHCLDIAASVRATGLSFDCVDCPDYRLYGAFIRPALEFHGVQAAKIAISMHGVISTSLAKNWAGDQMPAWELQNLRFLERLQFEAADLCYGLSRRYIQEWREQTGREAQYFDPMHFLGDSLKARIPAQPVSGDPEIFFIGRTERRKGPDLAIDLISSLPQTMKRPLQIIGPGSETQKGVSSESFLKQYAKHRNVELSFLGSMSAEKLADLLRRACIVLVPSRYDTFNLVALESLFSGCPTLIGDGAGVCDFLDERYPSIPYIKIECGNAFKSLPDFQKLIVEFQARRSQLVEALKSADLKGRGPSLEAIYSAKASAEPAARDLSASQFEDSLRHLKIAKPQFGARPLQTGFKRVKKRLAKYRVLRWVKTGLHARRHGWFLGFLRGTAARGLHRVGFMDTVKSLGHYAVAFQLPKTQGLVTELKDNEKSFYERAKWHRIGRGRLIHSAAYAEERRGQWAVAAAYGLRVLRWTQSCPPRLVADTRRWLKNAGFNEEARVVDLLYPQEKPEEIAHYLEERRQRLCVPSKGVYEFIEDNRPAATDFKVAVIVSMYRAASKLERFLELLKNQTLLSGGQVELILVDSGSPREEIEIIRSVLRKHWTGPVVYARTPERETIQLAWNRGLELSRAPNVCFLGVDESLRPDALEILSNALDSHPDVDWVMSDSIVTEVSTSGEWLRDVMVYDRKDDDLPIHILHALECCYLSYVGGLYRKAIHQRVGYYDPAFRAAGDTEFKNRAMPFIKAMHIPQALGIFLNYPEERTTQHPRAEIEDLRAWYLFRSESGLRYLTQNMPPETRARLFEKALGYRKSYCGHTSFDLDLATCMENIAPPDARLRDAVKACRSSISGLDWVSGSRFEVISTIAAAQLSVRRLRSLNRRGFQIFHDNRYEQHSNIW